MANDRSGLDVARLRADTRGCAEVVHLNNAGSALPPSIAVDTMVEHLRREEMIGGYEAHAQAADRIESVRDSIGLLLDTSGSNIALSISATDSWDRAFSAINFASDFRATHQNARIVVRIRIQCVASHATGSPPWSAA